MGEQTFAEGTCWDGTLALHPGEQGQLIPATPRLTHSASSGSSATDSASTTTHVDIGFSPSGANGLAPGSFSNRSYSSRRVFTMSPSPQTMTKVDFPRRKPRPPKTFFCR